MLHIFDVEMADAHVLKICHGVEEIVREERPVELGLQLQGRVPLRLVHSVNAEGVSILDIYT